MSGGTRSRGAIFLIEFLIMLLVFSIASVVSLKMFAKSSELRSDCELRDRAAAVYLTVSTQLKGYCDGDKDERFSELRQNGFVSFEMSADDRAPFAVRITASFERGLLDADIVILYDGEIVFSAPAAYYYGGSHE